MIKIGTSYKATKLTVEQCGLFCYKVGTRIRLKAELKDDYIHIKCIDNGLFESTDIWESERYNNREFLEQNKDYLVALARHLKCPTVKVGQTIFIVDLDAA